MDRDELILGQRYLDARVARVAAERTLRERRARPHFMLPILVAVEEKMVARALRSEAAALAAMEASDSNRFDIGGGFAIVRQAP